MGCLRCAGIILIGFSIAACWGDYAIDLGDDYSFTRVSGYNHVIDHEYEGLLIQPDVKDYAFNDHFIIGFKGKSEYPLDSRLETQANGYFIVNKKTKALEVGLAKDAFLNRLTDLNISLKL